MQIERIVSRGQLVKYLFTQDAVAASQTDVQLNTLETGATDGLLAVAGYTMPFDGEIVAITADLSAAAGAGTLTVGPTIGGTEKTDPTLSITTEAAKRDTCPRGTAAFVAGNVLGAEITSSGTWDGTASDLVVAVYVLLYVEGI